MKLTSLMFWVYLVTTGIAAGATPNLLVSGTYMSGSNLFEPRPQKSKLLETVNGGVVVMDGKAGFYLQVKLRKKTSKTLYSIIEYPNPLDESKPLRNDADLPNDGGTIGFSSPDFVKGLKIGTDYKITVKVYENRSAKEPIDILTQTVRSHVDATGPELKVATALKAASAPAPDVPERWAFSFDNRKWKLGSAGTNAEQAGREYILKVKSSKTGLN